MKRKNQIIYATDVTDTTEHMVRVEVEKQLEERFGPKPPQILTKKDL